jgi:hypothetical protein
VPLREKTLWRPLYESAARAEEVLALDVACGSLVGLRYRWTTPEMEGRVVAAIEQRLAVALTVAEGHKVT